MVATKPMTAEEFLTLPDDGRRYELIEGVPKRMPPAGLEHGDIGTTILVALANHVNPRGLGLVPAADTGFIFERDPDVVLAPDASFIRRDRLPPRETWRGFSTVVPDLAVEIVSPGDSGPEVAAKVAYYLSHGVREVWVVEPKPRQVTIHRRDQEPLRLGVGDAVEGGDLLPGFRLPLAEIFR